MKKILLLAVCFLLVSCSQPIENETDAVVRVAVHNEEYGNELKKLWDEKYPETSLEISVVTPEEIHKKTMNHEEIDYDVFMCEDEDIPALMDQLLVVKDLGEVKLNAQFHETFDVVKKVYQPISAVGDTYYMLDLNKIEADGVSLESFETMESVSQLDHGFYYLNHPYFIFSFLTSNMNYFPGKEKTLLNFNGDSFAEALKDFQKILELIGQNDAALFDNWFIENSYYSGFVTESMQLRADEEKNGGKYQIAPLPSIEGKALYTQASSYGYVVNANTQYPNAALNLITLMHSKAAIQLLCNDSYMIPLIPEEMLDEFDFGNEHIKEKALALNYACSKNWVGLENRSDGAIDFLLLDETIQKMKACDLTQVNQCQEQLSEEYEEWMK